MIVAVILLTLSCAGGCGEFTKSHGSPGKPLLLGIEYPIEPVGSYFPFFDGELRGIRFADATGQEFLLVFPEPQEIDRRLTLTRRINYGFDPNGDVRLNSGGDAGTTLLRELKSTLTRSGPIVYASSWGRGTEWSERKRYAHPIRLAELEKRLTLDEVRTKERERLQNEYWYAYFAPEPKTTTPAATQPTSDDAERRMKALIALWDFYEATAKAYGLLGPNGDR